MYTHLSKDHLARIDEQFTGAAATGGDRKQVTVEVISPPDKSNICVATRKTFDVEIEQLRSLADGTDCPVYRAHECAPDAPPRTYTSAGYPSPRPSLAVYTAMVVSEGDIPASEWPMQSDAAIHSDRLAAILRDLVAGYTLVPREQTARQVADLHLQFDTTMWILLREVACDMYARSLMAARLAADDNLLAYQWHIHYHSIDWRVLDTCSYLLWGYTPHDSAIDFLRWCCSLVRGERLTDWTRGDFWPAAVPPQRLDMTEAQRAKILARMAAPMHRARIVVTHYLADKEGHRAAGARALGVSLESPLHHHAAEIAGAMGADNPAVVQFLHEILDGLGAAPTGV